MRLTAVADRSRSVCEWVVRTLLMRGAAWMCFAGAAVALPLTFVMGALTALPVGLAFLAAGCAGLVLTNSRRALLPNERINSSPSERPLPGWLALLALAFLAVPGWTAIQLEPMISDFQGFSRVLSEMWGDTSGLAGLALMPVIAVLAVPLLVTVAATTFIVGSATLLVLTMVRSAWLPRAFLLFMLMQGAMVLASASGVATIERTIPVVGQAMDETSATISASGIRRSGGSLMPSCLTLAWALAAYLPFVPLLLSGRLSTVYAGVPLFATPWPRHPPSELVEHRTATGDDLEKYFKDAARFLDSRRSRRKDRE